MCTPRNLYFLMMLVLAGCTVGPKYECPEIELPCEWHSAPGREESSNDTAVDLDCFVWWEQLQDPLLNWLIECAAKQNLDLHIAATRVLSARSEKQAKKADLYPHIDATCSYDHVYFSKDALFNGILGPDCCHGKRNVDFFELGFDAEWEIDFFGLTAREIAALKAQEEATEETLRDVWVTLSAEVARNYIQLRALQERLNIIERSIQIQKSSIDLTNELVTSGLVGEIEASRLTIALHNLRAQKPPLELGIHKMIYKISILLGYAPGDLYEVLASPGCIPSLPCYRPIAVPSDLLRRRPDIRRAERELAASTERIGAAIAALFPRFSLRGFIGDISTHASSLFNPASGTWLGGPQLLMPIFNSKSLQQDVDYNKNMAQQALFRYQKTVLEALEETEGTIASFHFELERNGLLNEALRGNEVAHKFTLDLYATGVKDNLAVLAAEREVLAAEDSYVQSNSDLILHYIALYKALGGSWQPQECSAE